ncbi:aspartate aminotransferase family protein [Jatrophihabitans lederbergiae]|uniref:Aminotransferase class III-fold pyridoxal phosphate-dependent enzyme n=1 Tax=Jatrophihabitans lederbergiae TaxID=3075547 RepID=A0ABU2JAX7_9ACTN|nr:aminotransferase class III-fold pyridoxal phosphate-dependent enzyme [Jatrophihabitans sp. DSM 44399]MDT0262143.1 aminotransferase class III-fold pyridoxal phosphate-dependent enzyme [Jatrophihabitans sp. DSM 44399]
MTLVDAKPVETEAEILALYRAHLSKGRATLAELFGSHMEVWSEGSWLQTSDGEKFLNCGGYGVFIMGARHPIVMDAVLTQLHTHPIATRILLEPMVARAAEALTSITPSGLDRVHFALSGAEAAETGIKLARANGKRRLVSMERGYHGKTMGALSVTAKEVYQKPFRPLLPDVTHVPFDDLLALETELAMHPGEVCVVVEPVQGEGGVILPSPGYLTAISRLCRTYDGFLILDEIQTGLGRLGEWWGADIEGVIPDVLLTGKALGGGVLPVSAAIANRKTFSPFDKDPYIHTSTFSGAPVLMAAVCGAIQAIKEERLVTRAADLGARLLSEIERIARQNCDDLIVEVRGVGLMIGIEFVEAGLAGELLIELFNHGVVANHSMNGNAIVRFTPPAILTDSDVEYLLRAFDRATRDLIANRASMPKGGK